MAESLINLVCETSGNWTVPSPQKDSIRAVVIVWRLGYACEQFLSLRVGLGLDFIFVYLFRLNIIMCCYISLDQFILVLFAFVVLDLVSSVPSQEIG